MWTYLWLTGAAQAADLAWRTRSFQYAAEGKPIAEVMRDFAASQGLLVDIGPDVEGTVKGRFNLAPEKFLDLMSTSYGFSWYYNGAILQIAAAKGMKSALIAMPAARLEELERSLDRMRMKDRRFPIRYDPRANAAVVAGPDDYVDLIRDLAVQFERQRQAEGLTETRVFRLRYARAADRPSMAADGGRLSGIASILRSIYQQHRSTPPLDLRSAAAELGRPRNQLGTEDEVGLPGPARPNDPIVPQNARGDRRTPLSWLDHARLKPSSAASGTPTTAEAPSTPSDSPDADALPIIVADAEQNSVIIRDLPQRMARHEHLITELDQRPEMVEIEVHIIDVDESALDALGVDWQFRNDRLELQAAFGGQLAGTGSAPAPGAGATTNGSAISVVLNNAGHHFLSRITALEQQERARIVSRPRVATLNNVEALMDRKQTYQVRVAGLQAAELYSVSAGITMRVLPTISQGVGNERPIRLGVHVEDGQLLDRSVDNLPIVASSRLETEAVVKPGESLLIAGYSSELTATGRAGVPGLSRLPGVGALFRADKADARRFERLFLVSPRIVSP